MPAQEFQCHRRLQRRLANPKAPTLKDRDWAPYKEELDRLHRQENMALDKIMKHMQEEYYFRAK
jgi:hypothetical protein